MCFNESHTHGFEVETGERSFALHSAVCWFSGQEVTRKHFGKTKSAQKKSLEFAAGARD